MPCSPSKAVDPGNRQTLEPTAGNQGRSPHQHGGRTRGSASSRPCPSSSSSRPEVLVGAVTVPGSDVGLDGQKAVP